MTALAKERLKQSAKKKYAKQYKAFVKVADQDYQNWMNRKEALEFLSLVGQNIATTSEGRDYYTYDQWVKNRMPRIKLNPPVTDTAKVDILSDQFMKDYINSKTNIVRGHQIGDKVSTVKKDYKISNSMVTYFGEFLYGRNAGFSADMKTGKVTKVVYVPNKTVTYEQIISKYGQPTETAFPNKGILEYIAAYDKSDKGYNVYVGFDSFKGNVKYIVKEKVKK